LLRPGRFDRQVMIDLPDIADREAILQIHAANKPLAESVHLRRIAERTPGFSGADLANAINEAALLAARRHGKAISQLDFENAIEKVVAGPERKSHRLNEQEKRRVAHHEVGHALVAAYSQYADPVHKISVVPRGRAALGYTLQLPTDDQFLMTRTELRERLCGLLGGRAAEEIIYHEVTTGAENDLQRATALARQMVCMFGMSDRVGLTHCGQPVDPIYMGNPNGNFHRDCSEQTAREIDQEVKDMLAAAYAEAKEILTTHHNQLELVANELLKRETLDAETFYRLLGLPVPKIPQRLTAPLEPSAPADPVRN
jgi:cell division protease FtsH